MSYFSQWQQKIEDNSETEAYRAFVQQYYESETQAYEHILGDYPAVVEGTAAQVSEKLGFGSDMVIFMGFLDGVQSSLKSPIDLETVTDESPVLLDIDYERLYTKMHEANADWLYDLEAWDRVLDKPRREALTRAYRLSKIVRHEKIGRNDPCPCGSGKKYKTCCGRS